MKGELRKDGRGADRSVSLPLPVNGEGKESRRRRESCVHLVGGRAYRWHRTRDSSSNVRKVGM